MPHTDVGQLKGEMRMTYEEAHKAAQLMERLGGSFERNLALTYYRADSTNAQRLRNAFPEIFQKYIDWDKETIAQAEEIARGEWLDKTVEEAMKK
jgi:hypothetical protein